MQSDEDTIFALSTAPGRAAVAIIRVSGPKSRSVAVALGFTMPLPRVVGLKWLRDNGRILDQSVVLWFENPSSYTGEDLVELQVHGGRAVYDSVISVLARQSSFRYADPGEFSRRAVLNGRLDLTEAEAVNDLVNAETEAQRDLAIRQLEGSLSRVFDKWASSILRIRAHLEAYIDFPDEDLPDEVAHDLTADLTSTLSSMRAFLDDERRGERLRSGLRIAVVGPPNAGKSTFVNWLTDRDVAIVSEEAGTTRDVIEVHLDLAGFPVTVADTAGLRAGGGAVEIEGMKRARDWASSADLRILVMDCTRIHDFVPGDFETRDGDLVLFNKVDLVSAVRQEELGSAALANDNFRISMPVGTGLGDVLSWMAREARARMDVSTGPVISRARHRAALVACVGGVERGLLGLEERIEPEIVAENLRLASDDLGRICGRVDVEDLLDVVFRDFCIGK
jgi:tRNA modification GTPase